MPPNRRHPAWRHVLVATAATLIAVVPLAVTPASAEPGSPAPAGPAASGSAGARVPLGVAPGTYTITLITGDRVELTVEAGGQYQVSAADDAHIQSEAGPDGVYVYPEDALPAVQSDQLDRDLFNVAYLAANGYADAATGSLPVIVTYPEPTDRGRAADKRALAERVDTLPATTAPVGLASVNGAGVAVDKGAARQFWRTLTDGTTAGPAAARGLTQGVRKVWLDRRVTAVLDESVPLIGAPEAWSAGFDGSGVTVAVLDTGVDATHPDLAGKIAATKSFVPGVTTVADGHGHGTHVAATVAGTGAASGGSRKGVAPGARLAIGKVLDDAGRGPTAQIIAGMEWAATEQRADIVSMSLGAPPTDGGDPWSQSVNRLTADTGTLFVIAAGNSGPASETVSTPGTADAALTVAATDKADATASFSSRGPRRGDLALKPDIAAPGVGIVAARAAGTTMGTPVDNLYTRANGTSMATPHVAGAAAILAQQHPDWSPAELKTALMSTARDVGRTVYDRGAGRLDVARAVRQKVFATTANADYGPVGPATGPAAVKNRQIGYRNVSDQPVTLTLTPALTTLDGTPTPTSSLTVDRTVTVPAGGTATVTVAFDVSGLASTRYSGSVVATDEATGTRLTTPVAAVVEPAKVTLTIRTLDRIGGPIDSRTIDDGGRPSGYTPKPTSVVAVNVPGVDSVTSDVVAAGPGVERVRVVPGTYSLWRQVYWWDDADEEHYVSANLFQPQVSVTGDTEVVLDARKAERVTLDTVQPSTGSSFTHLRIERSRWDGRLITSTNYAHYVTPTPRVTVGTFRIAFIKQTTNEQLAANVRQPRRIDLHPQSDEHADQGLTFGGNADGSVIRRGGWVPFPAGNHTLDLVDAGFGDPADLAGRDLHGKLALMQWGDDRITGDGGDPETVLWTDRIANARKAGAVGVVLFPNPPVERTSAVSVPEPDVDDWPAAGPQEFGIPDIQLKRSEGSRLLDLLKSGPVRLDIRSDPNVRVIYHLEPTMDQQITDKLRFSFDQRDLARIDSTTHSAAPLGRAQFTTTYWKSGTQFNTGRSVAFAVPKPTLTEYFGPLAGDVLVRSKYTGAIATAVRPRVFDRPFRTTEQRNAAPLVPGAVPIELDTAKYPPPPGVPISVHELCAQCREGDRFLPSMQLMTGGGDYRGSTIDLTSRLYTASGTEIPRSTSVGLPAFVLPHEAGRYRLVQETAGVSSAWTFTSTPPQRTTIDPSFKCWGNLYGGWTDPCQPEPFVFLRYTLGDLLRLDNTVTAGRPLLFDVTAYHNPQSTQRMPDIAGLRMWTSADGGSKWSQVLVFPSHRGDGSRTYRVLAPRPIPPGATVSLKAEAWDSAGNRLEQTVSKAFTVTK
jgi:subtilisin family serine protease